MSALPAAGGAASEGFAERRLALGRLAAAIAARRGALVDGIVTSSKKTRRVAAGEVDLALARLEAFDEVAAHLAGRAPVGTVGIVLPGNASISNPVSTLGTAFLAGNRVVARFPAGSRAWAEQVEPLFTAHLPGVAFDHGPGPEFVAARLADPELAVLMVFGDDRWAAEYEPAFRAAQKKLIFEGPGKDPFLVLPGADLARAAGDAVRGAYYNAGQACTSPERFYVHAGLVEEFVERVVELTRRERLGEPESADVTVGPIVKRSILDRIAAQLEDARRLGGRVAIGGGLCPCVLADGTPAGFVEPTVLTGATSEMALMRDETFGPILPVQAVASEAEALALAGASRYGLAASVYGGSEETVRSLAVSHGQVFRDEIWLDHQRRHLHAPYGGRKRSGWVWEWVDGRFARRDGARTNAIEMSRPAAAL